MEKIHNWAVLRSVKVETNDMMRTPGEKTNKDEYITMRVNSHIATTITTPAKNNFAKHPAMVSFIASSSVIILLSLMIRAIMFCF